MRIGINVDGNNLAHGGHEVDGREISPFGPAPVNTTFEEQTAAIVKEVISDARITLSSQIGRIGFLERENAAIMNA